MVSPVEAFNLQPVTFLVGTVDIGAARDRALSWGDPGFEELLQSLGRKRTISDAAEWESQLNFAPNITAIAPDIRNQEPNLTFAAADRASTTAEPVEKEEQSTYQYQPHVPNQVQWLLQNPLFMQPSMMGQGGGIPIPLRNDDIRIGVYTKSERRERIEKFRAKRSKRVYRKQVKYDCRKKLADTRPRIKGRFVTKKDDNIKVESSESTGKVEFSMHGETSCESFMEP